MGEIEADTFLGVIMPGAYAAITSILVETRKRLGSRWLEGLLQKEGGPTILDVGAGGAGIIAMREILRAEWKDIGDSDLAADTKPPPLGRGTVVVGSTALRNRVSRLLGDTTFLPRLPDVAPKSGTFTEESQEGGITSPHKSFDVIIAPYTLQSIHESHQRKVHVQALWSLLNQESGVLIVMEKGLPRGFEAIAGARQMLLDNHIISDDSTHVETEIQSAEVERHVAKERGVIIAPCTNHTKCPLYLIPGTKQGRKDLCHFRQRFIRPPFLQRILRETERNHDDVTFSYVAVQRGQDGRSGPRGDAASEAAFAGHGDAEALPDPLSLPRAILPPLKRRGHIVLDLCTPSGKLERWTVPRSFGRQAYRDARKSQWGDLWGLGAKTRVERAVRMGEVGAYKSGKTRKAKQVFEIAVGDGDENEVRAKVGGYGNSRGEKRNKKGRKFKPSKPLAEDEF
jgi:ribosomal protein RSM22 (predicted rRNA methylase)